MRTGDKPPVRRAPKTIEAGASSASEKTGGDRDTFGLTREKRPEVDNLMKSNKPTTLREGAERVASVLRGAGFEAFFAGGCVRDGLLATQPKDYDIVTNARPEEVTRLFKRTIQVGASFGVVRVLIEKGFEYEVATYRKDGVYTDGRRPDDVMYSTSVVEDVKRRDFTINALLEDPATGEVIDHVGGRADLEAGLIRAVGDAKSRVAEDRLRMLRAVRFAARFGFAIEASTIAAIEAHAHEIRDVSAERITAELEGIWSSPRPGLGLELLSKCGLVAHVLPEVLDVARRSEQLARIPPLGLSAEAARAIAWTILFEGLDRKGIEAEMRRMKMSRDQLRAVQMLAEARTILADPSRAPIAEVRRLLVSGEASIYVAFQRALLGEGDATRFLDGVASELAADPLPSLRLVEGADLIALGIPPGPEYKRILDAVELAILERRVRTKDEGLALVAGLG